jgi:transcriptional regulator with XRE-family HTH domain
VTLPAPDGRTFTARLQQLFAERPNPATGRRWPDDQVAAAVGLSKAAVWNLRTGRTANPSMDTVAGLARFFGVAPSFFFDDYDGDAQMRALMADLGVRSIAARAADLSPKGREAVLGVLDEIRRLEGK